MQIPVWAVFIMTVGILGGYHWFKVGRHGDTQGYLKHKLGLREGEKAIHMTSGSYVPEKDLKQDIGLALVGMTRVGKNVMIALTDQGRLIIAHLSDSNPTIHLEKADVSSISQNGESKLNRQKIVEIRLKTGEQINLLVMPDGVGPLLNWAS